MLLVSAAILLACAVVGTDARAAEACPNEGLRRGVGASLPDCRAYEQVSPVEKNGYNITDFFEFTEASPRGDAVTFRNGGAIPGSVGGQNYPSYLTRREPTGWSTRGVFPPENCPLCAEVRGWSEDLSLVFDEAKAGPGKESLLARGSADGSFTPIVGAAEDVYRMAATSADDSTVIFEAHGQPLTPEATGEKIDTYAWNPHTGALRLLGVLPDGSPAPEGSFAGPFAWNSRGRTNASVGGQFWEGTYTAAEHVVSRDGAQVVFTAAGSGQLYVRQNPTAPDAQTLHVSASQKTNGTGPGGADPHGPQPAAFMGATPSGDHLLFTTPEELTNDATTGPADSGNDLYRYDPASRALTDLVPDTVDANGADVLGILGMSEHASYVYFVANGVLSPGAPAGTCKFHGAFAGGIASEGACDLYVWHDGVITYIAQMQLSTEGHEAEGFFEGWPDSVNWDPTGLGHAERDKTSRVAASGDLLFRTLTPLTGYDNSGCEERTFETNANIKTCAEFYRYAPSTGKLACVSCDPSGVPTGPAGVPNSHANLRTDSNQLAFGPSPPTKTLTRNLTQSGDRVFFNSSDSFLPGAVAGVEHVYEWEQNGSGSCRSEALNGGCLYLLSPPNDPDPSYFVDASADGSHVFIVTDRALVGQDQDVSADIYDVSVDGGLASQWPAPSVSCLSPEECRTTPAPTMPPPAATVTFFASGNLAGPPPPVLHVVPAKIRLHRAILRGGRASIVVDVPAAGTVTVAGAHTRTVKRRAVKRQSLLIPVALDRGSRSLLKRGRTLHLSLRVGYVPASGAPSSATIRLVLR